VINRRLSVILFLVFLLPSSILFAEKWVLAATPLECMQNDSQIVAASEQIPKLILADLVNSDFRFISLEELYYRKIEELKKERKSLIEDLSKAVVARDEVFLSGSDSSKKKNLIKEKEKAIEKVKILLEENSVKLKELQERKSLSEEEIKNLDKSVFTEDIVLWNNNSENLLKVESDKLQEKINSDKIRGLLYGTIIALGNYIVVDVVLEIYPGKVVVATASESGSVGDVVKIASSIANQLKGFIINKPNILVNFEISPEEAKKYSSIIIDGKIYSGESVMNEGVILSSGKHTVTIESEGFYPKTFSWNFSTESNYLASVQLEEKKMIQLNVLEKNGEDGKLYINALPAPDNSVYIDSSEKLILGQFDLPVLNEDGQENTISSFQIFNIDDYEGIKTVDAIIKAESIDISSRIEKRRRTMYNSYSAFMVSIIPTLFSYGMYVNDYNGWAMGHMDSSSSDLWNKIYKGSVAVTIGLGVNFFVQLGRYIWAVDKVMPNKAKIEE